MAVHDRVEQAEKLFKEQDPHNKSFQFKHCWLLLRNQPKWHDKLNQLVTTKKLVTRSRKQPEKSSLGLVDLSMKEVNDAAPNAIEIPEIEPSQRPLGKKKAKEAARQGGNDACKEALKFL